MPEEQQLYTLGLQVSERLPKILQEVWHRVLDGWHKVLDGPWLEAVGLAGATPSRRGMVAEVNKKGQKARRPSTDLGQGLDTQAQLEPPAKACQAKRTMAATN